MRAAVRRNGNGKRQRRKVLHVTESRDDVDGETRVDKETETIEMMQGVSIDEVAAVESTAVIETSSSGTVTVRREVTAVTKQAASVSRGGRARMP